MNIQFPLRLVQRGPGYYLIDAADRTIAAMTADPQDAHFVHRACNCHQDLLDACEEAPRMNTQETSSGSEFSRKLCACDDKLRAAIAKAKAA